MAVYDGFGIVAFVYWLRLKAIFVVPMKAQTHYGCDSLGVIWGMWMLSSCICSTLVSMCAMKGISIANRLSEERTLHTTSLLYFV